MNSLNNDIINKVNIKDIINNRVLLSPSNYKTVIIKNKNIKTVRDFLARKLIKGEEVGSSSYIKKSHKYFIRNKGLQEENFTPYLFTDSVVPILPSSFINYGLKKGDILISKDSNIGEAVILDKDYPDHMISGGMYKMVVEKYKYYLLAFLKHSHFKKQLNFLISRGATIKHAKDMFLDCKVPLPRQKNADKIIDYVELLTKSIIDKEIEIKKKDRLIYEAIENEINNNQKIKKFTYHNPKRSDLCELNRIDAAIYSKYFKECEFRIKNYKYGSSDIRTLGFNSSRGQNLQVSCIGESIYSEEKKKNFYTLILPKNISYYGTVKKYLYLGNSNELKTLKMGDIIFGAEGFEKGRSLVIFKDEENVITNILGITLNHKNNDMILSVFVKCFLDYLRKLSLIDIYAVGGNGGSLAQNYWDIIPFPQFPGSLQEDISLLYYNKPVISERITLDNYVQIDNIVNSQSGIIQLDEQIKCIKLHIDNIIDKIINDIEVDVDFEFLHECISNVHV